MGIIEEIRNTMNELHIEKIEPVSLLMSREFYQSLALHNMETLPGGCNSFPDEIMGMPIHIVPSMKGVIAIPSAKQQFQNRMEVKLYGSRINTL